MKRTRFARLAWPAILLLASASFSFASTPSINGASIQTRTFNDCPISTVTTTNNYPASIEITDVMDPVCVGFANLHSWSFSADGGATAAVFNNNSNFRFGADFRSRAPARGRAAFGSRPGGRSSWTAVSRSTPPATERSPCFGGRLPFYSFTANHGITYVKGTTIHLEMTYRARDLVSTDPATIQYRVVYNGTTYDSPVLPFDEGNRGGVRSERPVGDAQRRSRRRLSSSRGPTPAPRSRPRGRASRSRSCPRRHAGGQRRDDPDAHLQRLPDLDPDDRQQLPGLIEITDAMDPVCVGFANLHSWSFSEDGGIDGRDLQQQLAVSASAPTSRCTGPARGKGACGSPPGGRSSWTAASSSTPPAERSPVFGGSAPLLQLHREPRHHVRQGHDDPPGDDLRRAAIWSRPIPPRSGIG